ncbi:MAG: sugar ABC transporter ATP-binding protein [Spirochaetaceae bacterium]|nr:MAG: sugar ABC transporter ATP-binding protein [Spirochaetaceae bacterium]
MDHPHLVLESLCKTYPDNGVRAVDTCSLTVDRGEIHAIVGDNGAGKSTLMHLVSGVVAADGGTVTLCGVPVHGTADSVAHGIVMSYQTPRLVDELTVLENLFLGEEPRRMHVFFDRRAATDRVATLAPIIPKRMLNRRVRTLSSGQRRIASLVAALLRLPTDRPGVIILDEPTEATTIDETAQIVDVIRHTASGGHAVVLVSHRLQEVASIADRVTVMRAGRFVATMASPVSVADMARLMATDDRPTARSAVLDDRVAATEPDGHGLKLVDVSLTDGDRVLLDALTLELRSGEVTGFVGVRENGIEALELLLSGTARPALGHITTANGRSIAPRGRATLRPGYVPSDRTTRGSAQSGTVQDNLIAVERRRLSRRGIIDTAAARRHAQSCIRALGIDAEANWSMRQLSGGNVQKCILARELAASPGVLVVSEPGWGLDSATRSRVHAQLRRVAAEGGTVAVLSTDVDEALEVSDRIIALHAGRIVADLRVGTASRSAIARLVAGDPTA